MRRLVVAVVIVISGGCGGRTPMTSTTTSPSSGSSVTLAPWSFSPPAGTVLHPGDRIVVGSAFSSSLPWMFTATELVREDGVELMIQCSGGTGGLSSYATSIARGDYLYNFGVGHTMNAAIAGASFETRPSDCPFGSGLGSGPINWTVATQRVDVALNWRIEP